MTSIPNSPADANRRKFLRRPRAYWIILVAALTGGTTLAVIPAKLAMIACQHQDATASTAFIITAIVCVLMPVTIVSATMESMWRMEHANDKGN